MMEEKDIFEILDLIDHAKEETSEPVEVSDIPVESQPKVEKREESEKPKKKHRKRKKEEREKLELTEEEIEPFFQSAGFAIGEAIATIESALLERRGYEPLTDAERSNIHNATTLVIKRYLSEVVGSAPELVIFALAVGTPLARRVVFSKPEKKGREIT